MAVKIALRPFLPQDAPALAQLFQSSIETLGPEFYSEAQCEAWAASADDDKAFGERLAASLTILALIDGEIAGFAALKDGSILDMLYVQPEFARQKVATTLVDALEKLAGARSAKILTVEASDCAEAFFKQRAYIAQKRNMVFLDDEVLGNTTMTKKLSAADGKPS